jgi:hypothetical protein
MKELGYHPRLGTTAEDEAPSEADVEADDLDFNSYIVTRSGHMPRLKWLKGQVSEHTRDKCQRTLKTMKAMYSSTRCDLRSARFALAIN